MKVCIVQKELCKNPRQNIKQVIELIPEAVEKGANVICFSEWFLGTNPPDKIPNKFTDILSKYAKDNKAIIITGNFRIQMDSVGKKFIQVSCIFDENGEICLKQQKNNLYKGEKPWFISGNKFEHCDLSIGRVVVTSGSDCVSDEIYNQIKELKPTIWVAQSNEHVVSPKDDDYDMFMDLIKKKSIELSCTIIVPMMLGSFYGAKYTGRSYIIKNGEVIAQTNSEPDLLMCEL